MSTAPYDPNLHPRDACGHWVPSDQRGLAGKAMGYLTGTPQNSTAPGGQWHRFGDYLVRQNRGVIDRVDAPHQEGPHHALARTHLLGTSFHDLHNQARQAGVRQEVLPLDGATVGQVRQHLAARPLYHAAIDREVKRLVAAHPQQKVPLEDAARHLKGEGHLPVAASFHHHESPALAIKRFAATLAASARYLAT